MPSELDMARAYCPTCEPRTDPFAEILIVRYCGEHLLVDDGSEDARVVRPEQWAAVASGEAGGESNRRWCAFVHRGRL